VGGGPPKPHEKGTKLGEKTKSAGEVLNELGKGLARHKGTGKRTSRKKAV